MKNNKLMLQILHMELIMNLDLTIDETIWLFIKIN